jgi:predicted RNase H-like HicB family nuclease
MFMLASTYKILIEQVADGQSLATVIDFPDCQVTAMTPQAALAKVQTRLTERLASAQIISIEIPASQSSNPWLEFAGIFQDDPDFADIAQAIRAERHISDDEL